MTQEKYNELKRFECGPGDFIMSCSGTIGCLYQLPDDAEPGIINQALCKFHLNGKMLPEVFLTYMRNSVDQLETKGSAIKNIGAVSFIKKMKIALPPICEQEEFAEFIRQSDKSKFNGFKSQFIEHFGQLPEHFKHETIELGKIADMMSGGTPSSKHPEYYGGTIPFVSTPCLGKNYIDESDAQNWLTELGVEKSSTHIIPAYSVMFGSRVGVGKSSINTCEMCTNQDILSFFNIDNSRYDILFIKKVMDQYADYIETQKRGTTIKGVTSDVVKGIRVPIVSIEEQKLFAEFTEQSDKSKEIQYLDISSIDYSSKTVTGLTTSVARELKMAQKPVMHQLFKKQSCSKRR